MNVGKTLFALVHGYAHGTEMPPGESIVAYGFGFFAATALLHLLGFTLGVLSQHKAAVRTIRLAGAAISAAGMFAKQAVLVEFVSVFLGNTAQCDVMGF